MKITRALASLSFLLALAAACAAQEPQPTPTPEEFQTKLESLMSETGAVIVKGYTRVRSVNGSRGTAYVTALEVTDAPAGHKEQGLGVEISDAARPDAADEHAYIDYDEIAPLLKGIDYIMRLDSKATKLSRYEAQYRTRGGLVLVTFTTPNGQATAISTEGGRRARFVLRPVGLAEFRNLVESAKQALDAPPAQ
ncbi:MAG: hypothetical protein DMF67_16775 [Acidobacteria bacterium]|nr:MAG: hypothetical protein DMF67_16775 [Acidobacteriota bacterium]